MKKVFGILAVSAFLFASCGGNNTEAPVEEQVAPETEVVEEVAAEEEVIAVEGEEVAATEEAATEEVAA